ncbi:hypothetical protein E0I26_08180 [Flavobacterium rhamnosiphilum]|uniref:Uncharacterized protein n=1 Tax=Flavobacterium rhamnosiphilum TaxID=2541724 RepID=A0A4R5F7R0_9FLAO|nr:hypothetical protein [Flavobacterium rhamnosiphilum]TDE44340.1 hypothetical protein E0I26_08180 [Flavobacterium rhamnosiphilum]
MSTVFDFFENKNLLNGKGVCLMLFLGFISVTSFAQQKTAKPRKPDPEWVKAMEDPNANYYQAVAAFDAYWKNKVKPIEEDEMFETGGEKEKEEALREKRHHKLKADDPAVIYVYDYKRFQRWKVEMLPFVQADGRIQSMDDRVNDWKIQQVQKRMQKQREDQKKDKEDGDKKEKDFEHKK